MFWNWCGHSHCALCNCMILTAKESSPTAAVWVATYMCIKLELKAEKSNFKFSAWRSLYNLNRSDLEPLAKRKKIKAPISTFLFTSMRNFRPVWVCNGLGVGFDLVNTMTVTPGSSFRVRAGAAAKGFWPVDLPARPSLNETHVTVPAEVMVWALVSKPAGILVPHEII